MSLSQYLLGAVELAVIVAALGLGAYHLRAVLVPGWSGAVARLAEVVLGLSALILISQLLGVVGILYELPLVIACAAAGLGTAAWARPRAPGAPADPIAKGSTAAFAIAVAVSAVVIAHWAVPTQTSLNAGMYFQDTTWYHMSFSGRFAQTGEIWPLHLTDPLKLTAWFYPQNSELLHGVGMVAFDSDFLSPLMNIGWAALALLAAWCIGRPYGLGAATLIGAAIVLDSEMILGSQAGNAPNDVMSLFVLLAAIAFLITGRAKPGAAPRDAAAAASPGQAAQDRGPARDDDEVAAAAASAGPAGRRAAAGPLAGIGWGPILLAGLAAGIGVGTKITLLAALGVLTLGLIYLAGRRDALPAMGWWLGGMALTGGFWYLRNVWFARNPFPQIDKAGPVDLPGPEQVPELYPRDPHKLSEYYNDTGVWEDWLFPVMDDRLGPLWFVLLGVVAVGLVAALARGGDRLIRVLAMTGIVAGIAYVFTPLTASGGLGTPTGFDANLRYAAPALIVGLVVLPLIPALRRGNRPWFVCAVLLALLIQGSVTSGDWDGGTLTTSLVLTAALVGVPVAIFLAARRGAGAPALAGAALASFVVLAAIGRSAEVEYVENRYDTSVAPELPGKGFRASDEWKPIQQFGKETTGSRIAVVGRAAAFGQYQFYGDAISNHVQYIGYELARGTFRQIGSDCRLYRRTVNEGDYDYLVTTPRFNSAQDKEPKENLWTGQDPDAEVIATGGPARVFRLTGELDPDGCDAIQRAAERRAAEAKAAE